MPQIKGQKEGLLRSAANPAMIGSQSGHLPRKHSPYPRVQALPELGELCCSLSPQHALSLATTILVLKFPL